jgi:signal transduction histidine kinase
LRPVLLDVDQFEVAVLNLVVNARDAMPAGGPIVLSTSFVKEAALLPLDLQVGEYVVLAVSDSGEGMSDEVRARVFEPFFTTKRVGRGAGLGLSMVHGFVKQSGGSIMIDSRPDAGTTVRLFFPALRQAPEGEAVSDAGNARVPAGGLIVPARSEL